MQKSSDAHDTESSRLVLILLPADQSPCEYVKTEDDSSVLSLSTAAQKVTEGQDMATSSPRLSIH
jgi:hypothetical protein